MTHPEQQPLSWLKLERYALGELTASEAREVETQLAASQHAREALDAIRAEDDALLPPLPVLLHPTTAARATMHKRWLGGLSAGLAIAASLLLWVHRDPDAPASSRLYGGEKGSTVAVALWGEQSGSDPSTFAEGERFKLFFTCPTELSEPARVLVFQEGQRYEPLVELSRPVCGNRVPWPGAFQLTGDGPVHVCVAWGNKAEAAAPEQLGEQAVCLRLDPTR